MKKIITFLVLATIVSCVKNEELVEKGISAEEVTFLHNDNSKNWKVTHYYSNYKEKILDEDLTNCMKDDMYTFFSGKEEGVVEFGENSCYEKYSDVEGESAVATYSYYPEEKKLYLDFGRGAYSTENNVQTAWVKVTSCSFLSSDKMIFTNGTNGDGVGIVFEKI